MIYQITGKMLRELRKRNSMILTEVDKTGIVSSSYLSQLENGKVDNPSFDIIIQLLDLYRVKVEIDLSILKPKQALNLKPLPGANNKSTFTTHPVNVKNPKPKAKSA